jgi:hypothetical protein
MVKQGIGDEQMTTLERPMQVLADGGWHSTAELVQEVGHRFSATVHVAKQRGHQIEKRRVDKNQFEYRLSVQSFVAQDF